METEGKTINFLGDSITFGVGASCDDKCYVNVFKKLSKANVNNYGISGTRIAKQIKPYCIDCDPYDFVSRYTQMDDADVVFVFGGTNDFGHGDAELGDFSSSNPYTFCGALNILLKGLCVKYCGKVIILVTPLHRCTENERVFSDSGHQFTEYIDAIIEAGRRFSVPVLDLYATSGIQAEIPEIKELLIPDGLHPSDAGHSIIAHRMYNFIKSL